MKKLPLSFYRRKDVLQITKELLGKFLVTKINGALTSGMIVEAEAYAGVNDMASHARNGIRTSRNEIMYAEGGTAYVYICYGIHQMFNVVTNEKETPHAILIRAVEPVEGVEVMMKRRAQKKFSYALTKGPGSLARALGIHVSQSGVSLQSDLIWIEDRGVKISSRKISTSKRVGVESAGNDALLHYRYFVSDSKWISRTPK